MFVAGPDSNGQSLFVPDLLHSLPQQLDWLLGVWPFHPNEHGEELFGVPVIHLDFVDVGSRLCHVVNNRICESTMIRPDSSDDDLHSHGPVIKEIVRRTSGGSSWKAFVL